MTRHLIVNADDFGASTGVNRGIVDCHVHGIVTSASVMVTGRAIGEAVALSRDHPALSLGLHWDVLGEDEREFDMGDTAAIRREFRRQLDRFAELFGRLPTHVDSHRHVHRERLDLFRELVAPLGLPLRHTGEVTFVGGFYAQWEWKVTNLAYVSVGFLRRMLAEEVQEGWTELSCHPGYRSPDYVAVYLAEREAEVATLVAPEIRSTLGEHGIQLRSYADYLRAARTPTRKASH